MGTFQRSITVLYAIGLEEYLRLEVDASYIPIQYPVNGTLELSKPSQFFLRGYHTVTHVFPDDFG